MEKLNFVYLVFVIRGGECSSVGFGFGGLLIVVLRGKETLSAEAADVGADTVAERFAGLALNRIAVVEGLSGGVSFISISVSIAVESVDLSTAGDDWMAGTEVLIRFECANEVVVPIFRGDVGAMIGVRQKSSEITCCDKVILGVLLGLLKYFCGNLKGCVLFRCALSFFEAGFQLC